MRQGAACRKRAIPRVREDEPSSGGLNREAAAEEREAHHEERDVLHIQVRDVAADDDGNATCGDHLAEAVLRGRDGEDEGAHQDEAGQAGGEEGRDDGARDALRGVHHFFGNVTGRFESVEDVYVRQDGDERGSQPPVAAEVDAVRIGGRVLRALRGEQIVEAVMEPGHAQEDRNADRADNLEVDADLGYATQEVDAPDVEEELDRDEDHGEGEDLIGIGGVEVGVEDVVEQRACVDDDAGVDRRHGDDQRPAVDPPDPPAVAGSH